VNEVHGSGESLAPAALPSVVPRLDRVFDARSR
jgi:hypothetical protein